jgi:hypothetical protein
MADIEKLLTDAGERWRAGQPAPPTLAPIGPRQTRRPDLGWAVIAAALVVALAAGAGSLGGHRPTASVEPGLSPVAVSTEAPSATPAASLELSEGIPVAIQGQPVLVGQAASNALRAAADNTPVLIGGWLHPAQVMSCPVMLSPSPWNPCAATRLFPSPFAGPEAMGIFRGPSGPGLPTIPDGSVQAVVLRVHSHDPACKTGAECIGLPVLDAVVWSSPVQPIAAPTSTRPPTGMAESAAIEAAIRVASGQTASGITVIAVQSGPYAIVGPGDSGFPGDSWAWAITVGAIFDPPDCYTGASAVCSPTRSSELVVFDYVTGAFVIADSPAPKPGPTTNDAGKGAINLVSKLEIDRAAENWDDAWGLLGPLSQQRIGSEAQFVALETTYNEAGRGFRIDQVIGGPFGPAMVDTYFGLSAFLNDLVRAGGDPNQAQLVIVTHPDEAGVGGSGAYLVAHVTAGWRIWIVN